MIAVEITTKGKQYADMARDALNVQDACNLSGVVFSFVEVVRKLGDYAHEHAKGTAWKNKHPLVQLWVDKLGHLAGTQGFDWHPSRAYEWADAQAGAGDEATLEYGWAE